MNKREYKLAEASGMCYAMELYQDCREHGQTEAEAIESVLKTAQLKVWLTNRHR